MKDYLKRIQINGGCCSHRNAYMSSLRTVQKYTNISIDTLNKNVHYISLKRSFKFCGFVFSSERSLFSVLPFPPF